VLVYKSTHAIAPSDCKIGKVWRKRCSAVEHIRANRFPSLCQFRMSLQSAKDVRARYVKAVARGMGRIDGRVCNPQSGQAAEFGTGPAPPPRDIATFSDRLHAGPSKDIPERSMVRQNRLELIPWRASSSQLQRRSARNCTVSHCSASHMKRETGGGRGTKSDPSIARLDCVQRREPPSHIHEVIGNSKDTLPDSLAGVLPVRRWQPRFDSRAHGRRDLRPA
jgi:hypothetical protein